MHNNNDTITNIDVIRYSVLLLSMLLIRVMYVKAHRGGNIALTGLLINR
jgi:hypothetical protein